MSDTTADAPGHDDGSLYGAAYYASHCGPVPYERSAHWLAFFGTAADELVRAFSPARVFDAGCALGLLVECLWDRGVEAHGRDLSPWAIEQARPDIRRFCGAGSIADPIEGSFDLLTCIEVLEHMPEEAALAAIATMARAAPRILFSSSPTDFDEPTHCNVRPTAYWLARWAEAGFAPLATYDAGYLAPHAYVLERSETGRTPRDLAIFADRIRYRVGLAEMGAKATVLAAELAAAVSKRDTLKTQLARQEIEDRRLRAASAQRAAEARVEAESMRARAGLAESEAARLAEILEQLGPATAAEVPVSSHAGAAASVQAELVQAGAALQRMTAERDRVLMSTAWRATWPLRAAGSALPRPVRSLARRSLNLGWWTVTGQLGGRLRQRRAVLRDTASVAASSWFDAAWYRSRHADVEASGLDPALHYATIGGKEGRDPGPRFSAAAYAARHPGPAGELRPALLSFLDTGGTEADIASIPQARPPLPSPPFVHAPPRQPVQQAQKPSVPAPPVQALEALIRDRFPALEPLRIYAAPHHRPRLSIVTDSINADSLYGGVGTALILAVLLAQRLGSDLRLVTRTKPADAIGEIGNLLAVQGIAWDGSIESCHSPPGNGYDVPAGPHDVFLTTSWWTTWATRRAVSPARIAYLLQEDERGFYPLGDDSLRCTEMLSDPAMLYIVNSHLLMNHLQAAGLAQGGIAFEPAFPISTYFPAERTERRRHEFFFYARPNNPRNLYWRGLEAIGAALEEGVLDPDLWNLNFVGLGAQDVALPGALRPLLIPRLPWADYASFVRRMDLGLSLMDTPHPSYPPLDLAASGAVVVTNRYGPKQSLNSYSENIVCAGLSVPELVGGLREGVTLALNTQKRVANTSEAGLGRDWHKTLAPALDSLAARFGF